MVSRDRRGFWAALLGAAVVAAAMLPTSGAVQADDIISVDYSAVGTSLSFCISAKRKRRLDSRIIGYANWVPRFMRRDLQNGLFITASTPAIDGVGGILGQAGPTATTAGRGRDPFNNRRFRNMELPVTGQMQFDIADIENLLQRRYFGGRCLSRNGPRARFRYLVGRQRIDQSVSRW